MVEKELKKVEYGQVKMEILKRVNNEGPLGDMESWKKAFADLDFFDLVIPNAEALERYDAGILDGMVEVNWKERTVAEKIFYVAYMYDPCSVEIRYDVVVEDELKVSQAVNDSEVIWYMWVSGCFSGEDLTEEALRDFVGLMTDEHQEKRDIIDDLDLEQIQIVNLEAKVAQIR
jgi:hypothetical protein